MAGRVAMRCHWSLLAIPIAVVAAVAMSAVVSPASALATQGPVAAWSFDEGTGTTAEDLTGDGHTATLEGPNGRPGTSSDITDWEIWNEPNMQQGGGGEFEGEVGPKRVRHVLRGNGNRGHRWFGTQ